MLLFCLYIYVFPPGALLDADLLCGWATPIADVLRPFRAVRLLVLFDGLHPSLMYCAPSADGLHPSLIYYAPSGLHWAGFFGWTTPIAGIFLPFRAVRLLVLFDGLHPSLLYYALSGLDPHMFFYSMGCIHR